MRCSALEALLRSLGFIVEEGRSGKHRTVEHKEISEVAANFDGGHGKDAEIKRCYVRDMRKMIEKYQDQLDAFLEKEK